MPGLPPGQFLTRAAFLICCNAKTATVLVDFRRWFGTTITKSIDGDSKSHFFGYIDWRTLENNVFQVTAEFLVDWTASSQMKRCDIVAFVNGVPILVIENKRPTERLKKADITAEREILAAMRSARDGSGPLAQAGRVEAALAKGGLTEGQREVVRIADACNGKRDRRFDTIYRCPCDRQKVRCPVANVGRDWWCCL